MNINVEDIIIEKKSNGYSAKIGNVRLCNIYERNELYKVKCRSKAYADALLCEYKTTNDVFKSRNYHAYHAILDKEKLEKWLVTIREIGIDKRLDNR